MLHANKSKWFRQLFYTYQKLYLFPRHFHSVGLRGDVDSESLQPTLYIANHSSWWDGLMIFQMTEKASKGDHYIMMDEGQLARYSFFRKLGAFSVDKKKPRAVLESLTYATELLRAGKSVWLFPQGEIRALEKRPLAFQSGLSYLLQKVPNTLVKPVTFYYAFDHQQKPTASAWFGPSVQEVWQEWNRKGLTAYLEEQLEAQLQEHKTVIMETPDYPELLFSSVVKTGKSTSDRFDRFKRGFGG